MYLGPLWIFDAAEEIIGGMSGSPIKADVGVIGLMSVGREVEGNPQRDCGPHPILALSLPAWLRDDLLNSKTATTSRPPGERLYTVAELARTWHFSYKYLRTWFENEEGVIKWSSGKTHSARPKPNVSLRIPASVALRVYRHHQAATTSSPPEE
jgi:hypothetical protein